MKLAWLIYNIVLPIGLILAAPSYLTRMRKRGQANYRWKERFGVFDSVVRQRLMEAEKPVWIHAVSVGEVKMAEVLIRELHRIRPQQDIVLSTTTITGRRLAEKNQSEHLTVIFRTVDLWLCVKRVFSLVNPSLVLLVEQELWPNQLVRANQQRVPVWVVNARLSDRSQRRFRKFSALLRPWLEMLSFIGVQAEPEIQRFVECGFPAHKLFDVGSMKYDVVPELPKRNSEKQEELSRLKSELGWGDNEITVLCGSTHAPEEDMLLRLFRELKSGQRIRVMLVPRHAERASEMISLCQSLNYSFMLKSEVSAAPLKESPDVLIVDTTGELAELYGCADVNIIGKSFHGVGGQNFLEAARYPVPVVVGPEMSNFKDTVELFKSELGLVQVQNERELLVMLEQLLEDSQLRGQIGNKAVSLMEQHSGAARRQAQMVATYLASGEVSR